MLRNDFSQNIQKPAVAGTFYPAHPGQLGRMLDSYLMEARPKTTSFPKALISPHAGCIYSGPIAASAFVHWKDEPSRIKRIVLLGPSHHVEFSGIALNRASAFATPLGTVAVDAEGVEQAASVKGVSFFEEPYFREHALEMELIFLQRILGEFAIVPMLIGCNTPRNQVSAVVDKLWGGNDTVFVVSSDLSHYYDYRTAQLLDRHTADAIESLQPEKIGMEHACGWLAIQGLLDVAADKKLQPATVDLRNSGDTAGSRDAVVGYGAFTFTEKS